MLRKRASAERGHAQHGWLDSRHTFSFAGYYDPDQMGFRSLRVINEDFIRGGAGFGSHPHRDMEILTYVLEGGVEHKDSLGTGSVVRPGEAQIMSAGSGIVHSEFNASAGETLHLLQIWIHPNQEGLAPRYAQKEFPLADQRNRLHLIVSPDESAGSLAIKQDARVFAGRLDSAAEISHPLAPGRGAWIQVARGSVSVNGLPLEQGDGLAVEDETGLEIRAAAPAEILLFDLA